MRLFTLSILLFPIAARCYAFDSSRIMRDAHFCFDQRKLNITAPKAKSFLLLPSDKNLCSSDVVIHWRIPSNEHDGALEIQVLTTDSDHQLRQFLFSVSPQPALTQETQIDLKDPILAQVCERGLHFDLTPSANGISLRAANGEAQSSVQARFKSSPPIEDLARSLAEDMKLTVMQGLETPPSSSTALKLCWAGLLTVISDFDLRDVLSTEEKMKVEGRLYPPDFTRPRTEKID